MCGQSSVAHGAWADSPVPLQRRALAAEVAFIVRLALKLMLSLSSFRWCVVLMVVQDALLSVSGMHPVAVSHAQLLAAMFALLERQPVRHTFSVLFGFLWSWFSHGSSITLCRISLDHFDTNAV
jgi:hypothetical protein